MENPLLPHERALYEALWFLEHAAGVGLKDPQALERWMEAPRAQLRTAIAERLAKQGTPGVVREIERVRDISPEEFHTHYLRQGRPVILEGFAERWPAVSKWTPEFIANLYGDDKVTLINAAPDDMNRIDYRAEETTLRDVILNMDREPLKKYSRFNRLLHEHPELKDDFDVPWLLSLRNLISSGDTFQVFIGGKGSRTHLHAAAEHNVFVQVYGRKHWTIYHPTVDTLLEPPVNRTPYFHSAFNPDEPDYERFPGMRYVDRYEFELAPGDVYFMPPSWWHHVNNPTGSIGVAFRWFAPVDCLRANPMQMLLTLMSVNPPIWEAMGNRTDFPKIFSVMSRRQAAAT